MEMVQLLDHISQKREDALKFHNKFAINNELVHKDFSFDELLISRVSDILELMLFDLIQSPKPEKDQKVATLREYAKEAFILQRMLTKPEDPIDLGINLLRMVSFAVLGDKVEDVKRILGEMEWPNLPLNSEKWNERTWSTIIDIWLRLIRKNGWNDLNHVLERVTQLRTNQKKFEKVYLDGLEDGLAKTAALELIGLYHLAKAAEILAIYTTNGVVERNYQVNSLLDLHFEKTLRVCKLVPLVTLELLTRLLQACSKQMVENSIWTITRSVNSKVTKFVETLVDKGRENRAIFEVLPPQREALAENGLLGSSKRAIVVSLPTSSGKTLIAQFRILQALNQFDQEKGWVAYLAPTRALVNQVDRQLRRDFAPLSVVVEKISPALEVDSVEMGLLEESSDEQFRVLVTTPEKLDLILRQGWEDKIGRPLSLVVVDEAHNIRSKHRGLRLELLLTTINKECAKAQFLLLTPFIQNAKEVAVWLGGKSADDISLSLDWQPNDRAIGISWVKKGERKKGNSNGYSVSFETIQTTRKSIFVDDLIHFEKNDDLADTFAKANKINQIASLTAQNLKERGPLILMHSRIDWVLSLAKNLKKISKKETELPEDVKFLQDYVRFELGDGFELVELLEFGIAVHHSGLPDEVRTLIEWVFERGSLKFLVTTTTIAQGINFPVSGVIMASHQYFSPKGAEDMPPEDFWNIAGRTGRISQGQLGVVSLVSDSEEKNIELKNFINKQTEDLNSALIQLALESEDKLQDLGKLVYSVPEWSSFLQYLSHSYEQMGRPKTFTQQVEQVLRGTLGFEKLKLEDSHIADKLLNGVIKYCDDFQVSHHSLGFVDSTGFSIQSIKIILSNKQNIDTNSWDADTLYAAGNSKLTDMMGVLLKVPELRDHLNFVSGGNTEGDKLANILKAWVGEKPLTEIAKSFFDKDIEKCGQHLFGKLTQSSSWGLSALLSVISRDLDTEEKKLLNNLPAKAFYGVQSDEAIKLRLIGIPRTAAQSVANHLYQHISEPVGTLRKRVSQMSEKDWNDLMGSKGKTYRRAWRIIEGLE